MSDGPLQCARDGDRRVRREWFRRLVIGATAAGWVLLMFSIPPLARMLGRPDRDERYALREVTHAVLPPPQPATQAPETEPVAETEPEPIAIDLPTPSTPRLEPQPIQPDWTPSLPSLSGDFHVQFRPETWQPEMPVFSLAEVDTPPRPVMQPPPLYPAAARQAGIEGAVEMTFVVTVEGRVENVRVVTSQPGSVFVAAAREAVERWRFEPAHRQGKPVAVRVRVPLEFRLDR